MLKKVFFYKLFSSILFLACFTPVSAQSDRPAVTTNRLGKIVLNESGSIENKHHPQVAYWFITPDLLENNKYLSDIDSIARAGIFDLVFLTSREGSSFYDTVKMRPVFEQLVMRAHQKGIKIGLQLWQDHSAVQQKEDMDALVSEKEITLDQEGRGTATLIAFNSREFKSVLSELLNAVAFRKTGNGFYEQGSLVNITSYCKPEPGVEKIEVKIDAGKKMAGYQVFLSGVHYVKFANVFGDYFVRSFGSVLEAYKNIPFDATGLDEFKSLTIKRPFELKDGIFHEKKYSLPLARLYKQKYKRELSEEFFKMRYAPVDKEAQRIQCINQYMEEIRNATTKVENFFYSTSKKIFGQQTFSGLHNTFHRSTDEFWQTGKNYWNIPREYGHTDETESKPVQMGLLYTHKMNMMYNMFYDKDTSFFLRKACEDLAYNIRTHYHAINDHAHGWGVSVETPIFQKRLAPIEKKAKLLNQFNPAAPKTNLLIVFGFEAVLNWYPDSINRDPYDLNDRSTKTFEKADSVWKAGYVTALLPADQIANGQLQLNERNEIVYNGHRFKSLIFLYPQFAKETTIRFLEKFVERGGKLMLEGKAIYDFNGKNVKERFDRIRSKAAVNGFDISSIPELGIRPQILSNGTLMEDGSWVKSDFNSIDKGETARFDFTIDGDRYQGSFEGVVAIKASKKNGIEKFTCGGFKKLVKNGSTLMELDRKADVLIEKIPGKGYKIKTASSNQL